MNRLLTLNPVSGKTFCYLGINFVHYFAFLCFHINDEYFVTKRASNEHNLNPGMYDTCFYKITVSSYRLRYSDNHYLNLMDKTYFTNISSILK